MGLRLYPNCGAPLTMNLRSDERFVQDEGWYAARAAYERFLRRTQGKRLLFLELGVGSNTPGIIKYPFWQLAAQNPRSLYACLNLGEAEAPAELRRRSLLIDDDIGAMLAGVRRVLEMTPAAERANDDAAPQR